MTNKPTNGEIEQVISILNRLEPSDINEIDPKLIVVVNNLFGRTLKKLWLGENDVVSFLREQQSNKDLLKKLERVHNIIQQTYADNVESARAAGINSMREARTAEVNSKGIAALTTQASYQTLIQDFQDDPALLQLQQELSSSLSASSFMITSKPHNEAEPNYFPQDIAATSTLDAHYILPPVTTAIVADLGGRGPQQSSNILTDSNRYTDATDFKLPNSEVVCQGSETRAGGIGRSRGRKSTFKVGRIRGLYDEVDTDLIGGEGGAGTAGDVRRKGTVCFCPRASGLQEPTLLLESTNVADNNAAPTPAALSGSEKHEIHAGHWLCYVKDEEDGKLRACALRTIVDLAGALENLNRPLLLHDPAGYNYPCTYMIGGRRQKWALLGGEVQGLCGETAITVKLATSAILAAETRTEAATGALEGECPGPSSHPTAVVNDMFCPKKGDFRLNCNVCKSEYLNRHPFYHQLCPRCGDFNYMKRLSSANLTGYVCLVTGGRVRIGYQIVLKLLRAGATVITTTRWVYDAANRYSQEADFESFRDRLQIHFLELSDIPAVESYCDYLLKNYVRIHVLINNAAQTITRPEYWHSKMNLLERHSLLVLPSRVAKDLLFNGWNREAMPNMANDVSRYLALSNGNGDSGLLPDATSSTDAEISADKSCGSEEIVVLSRRSAASNQWMTYDESGQPLDSAGSNSWSRRLHDVSATEVAETMAVNSISPFLLTSKLKSILSPVDASQGTSSSGGDDGLAGGEEDGQRNSGDGTGVMGHVINVTSLEGKFNVGKKSTGHPHTNMGKAALNMLTLTSARDYLHSGIFMNAVDTGWVTDMAPGSIGNRSKMHETFVGPPLDETDGAARVVDPVFAYVNSGGKERLSGNFLKDYMKASW